MRLIHPLSLVLSLPLVLLFLCSRALRDRRWLSGWGERFLARGVTGPVDLWIHAASVGEVEVAAPVVRALLERSPALRVHLSCITPTGRARAEALLGERVRIAYLPYDLGPIVGRALARAQPRALVLVETELWPGLIRRAAARGTRVLLVNARVSPRAAARYRRLPNLVAEMLGQVHHALAQSTEDAERLCSLGLAPRRLEVSGNIKLDRPAPEVATALAARLDRERRIWVAGSVRAEELEAVIAAHAALRARCPDALLVLAPRHPERFDAAYRRCVDAGLATARRSTDEAVGPETAVLLLDTLGELAGVYGLARCAFVGGSLVPVGGHSLVEPAAAGIAVLAGPHLDNTRQVAAALSAADALFTVADADALAAQVGDLFEDPAAAAAAGSRARAVIESGRGALARSVERVAEALSDP